MEELAKDRRRAVRRKRNLIAKELRTNKAYAPKVVGPKKKRQKVAVRDVYEDEFDGWTIEDDGNIRRAG